MLTRKLAKNAALGTLVASMSLVLAGWGFAHPGCSSGAPSTSHSTPYGGGGTFAKDKTPEQQICPVCQERLGNRGAAVPVETISAQQSNFFQKLFRLKPKGVVVLACSKDCAAQVKTQPAHYYMVVLNQARGSATGTGDAPNMTPSAGAGSSNALLLPAGNWAK